MNGILLTELTSVTANLSNESVTVAASRSLPALFARVVGINNFTVTATSVAVLRAVGSASGVAPVGLDSGTSYSYGSSITLHNGGCGPGCWQGLALQSQSDGSTGGSAFQQNLSIG